MLLRKPSALLIVLGLLFLAGCNTVNSPWTLVWSPSNRSLQSNPPQAAYEASAYALKPDGTMLHPAANIWLATGSHPTIGLALSQLDAAGQFFSAGVITVDAGSGWWTLTDTVEVSRPVRGGGVPAAQEGGRAWTLPPGTYSSASVDVPDTPPGGSLQLWVSDRGQEFVLARLYSTLQPPAGSTSVTLAGQPGWLVTQGDFTIIALVLDTGIYQGLGTLLFAGNVGLQQSELLVTQAAANLNDLLPA
jgi:hypothetical protein